VAQIRSQSPQLCETPVGVGSKRAENEPSYEERMSSIPDPRDAQRVLSHQCVGGENLSAKCMKLTIPVANILTNTDKLATIYVISKVIVYLKFTLIFS
jgi:hypothetical protein